MYIDVLVEHLEVFTNNEVEVIKRRSSVCRNDQTKAINNIIT